MSSDAWGWVVLAVYLAGYVVAWCLLVRHWMTNFGGRYRDEYEEYTAAAWAFLGALVWPAFAVFIGFGWATKFAVKRLDPWRQ